MIIRIAKRMRMIDNDTDKDNGIEIMIMILENN